MTGLNIDNRISFGNILVVVTMAVGGIGSWAALSASASRTADEVAATKAAIASHDGRIRAIENSSARQDERLMLILDSVRKIEAKLESRP